MHGIILSELRKFTEASLGANQWDALLEKAGLKNKVYMSVGAYPDSEVMALVSAASEITGRPIMAILEDIGEFIAPSLMAMYGAPAETPMESAGRYRAHRRDRPRRGARAK